MKKTIVNSKNGGSLVNNHKEAGYFPGIKGRLLEGDSLGSIYGSVRALWPEPGRSDPLHIPFLCFCLGPSESTTSRDIVRFNQLLFKDRSLDERSEDKSKVQPYHHHFPELLFLLLVT